MAEATKTEGIAAVRQILNHLEREDPEGAYDIARTLTPELAAMVKSGLLYIVAAVEVAQHAKAGEN